MTAAVFHAAQDIRAEQVPIPDVGPRDVLLAVRAVGICGSDLHMYRRAMYGARRGWILGHEFCGVAVTVGREVEGVALGERFSGFSVSYCGGCWGCTHGQPRLCAQLFANYSGYGKAGAMAEYVLIEDAVLGTNLVPVPDGLSDETAAMAEPLGTALYAAYRAKPKDGDQVVIIGAGLIGNLLIQAFKALADVRVIVTEISPQRSALARAVGADEVLDASRPDLLAAMQEATGAGSYAFGPTAMADVVVDAAAAPETFGQALEFVRSKGTVCLIGSPEAPSTVDTGLIVMKDIRVIGVFGSTIPDGMHLLAEGRVDTDRLVSHRFALEDVAEAFRVAAGGEASKVLILPTR